MDEGIPGHAGKGVSLVFQKKLAEMSCRFEAEGDITRIHVSGAIVEVKDEPGQGPVVEASLQLASDSLGVGETIEGFKHALLLLSQLGRPMEYDLDKGIPGFYILRILVRFEGLEDAYDALIQALERVGC